MAKRTSAPAKLTSKGKELFSQTAQSWNSYLALNPPKPNPTLAKQMVRVFGEEGLNQPSEEVQVLQIVVAGEPQSAALFGALAEYAYKAHNTASGRPRLRKGGQPRARPPNGRD